VHIPIVVVFVVVVVVVVIVIVIVIVIVADLRRACATGSSTRRAGVSRML